MEDFSLWKAISFNPWWLGLFIMVGKRTWRCSLDYIVFEMTDSWETALLWNSLSTNHQNGSGNDGIRGLKIRDLQKS